MLLSGFVSEVTKHEALTFDKTVAGQVASAVPAALVTEKVTVFVPLVLKAAEHDEQEELSQVGVEPVQESDVVSPAKSVDKEYVHKFPGQAVSKLVTAGTKTKVSPMKG